MARRLKKRSDTYKVLADTYHYHLCKNDDVIYEDTCSTPGVDELCYECRGVDRPQWQVHMLPLTCCTPENMELVALVDTFALYRLGGEKDWALCQVCSRRQIYRSK